MTNETYLACMDCKCLVDVGVSFSEAERVGCFLSLHTGHRLASAQDHVPVFYPVDEVLICTDDIILSFADATAEIDKSISRSDL